MRILAIAILLAALGVPAVAGPCSTPPPVNTSALPSGPSAG